MCSAACRRALRRQCRARRLAIPPSEREQAALAAARYLRALPQWQQARWIAAYCARDGELDPWPALLAADAAGIGVALPRTDRDGRMRFHAWRPGQPLEPGFGRIPQPLASNPEVEALDLVLLPLLGFDLHGQRLGHGAGCYDRYFAPRLARPAPPWLVGYAYALQQCPPLRAEAWDVPLDLIVTESGVIEPMRPVAG